jgi:hypothetical protein
MSAKGRAGAGPHFWPRSQVASPRALQVAIGDFEIDFRFRLEIGINSGF